MEYSEQTYPSRCTKNVHLLWSHSKTYQQLDAAKIFGQNYDRLNFHSSAVSDFGVNSDSGLQSKHDFVKECATNTQAVNENFAQSKESTRPAFYAGMSARTKSLKKELLDISLRPTIHASRNRLTGLKESASTCADKCQSKKLTVKFKAKHAIDTVSRSAPLLVIGQSKAFSGHEPECKVTSCSTAEDTPVLLITKPSIESSVLDKSSSSTQSSAVESDPKRESLRIFRQELLSSVKALEQQIAENYLSLKKEEQVTSAIPIWKVIVARQKFNRTQIRSPYASPRFNSGIGIAELADLNTNNSNNTDSVDAALYIDDSVYALLRQYLKQLTTLVLCTAVEEITEQAMELCLLLVSRCSDTQTQQAALYSVITVWPKADANLQVQTFKHLTEIAGSVVGSKSSLKFSLLACLLRILMVRKVLYLPVICVNIANKKPFSVILLFFPVKMLDKKEYLVY